MSVFVKDGFEKIILNIWLFQKVSAKFFRHNMRVRRIVLWALIYIFRHNMRVRRISLWALIYNLCINYLSASWKQNIKTIIEYEWFSLIRWQQFVICYIYIIIITRLHSEKGLNDETAVNLSDNISIWKC